jgi:hypothetical protein
MNAKRIGFKSGLHSRPFAVAKLPPIRPAPALTNQLPERFLLRFGENDREKNRDQDRQAQDTGGERCTPIRFPRRGTHFTPIWPRDRSRQYPGEA